MSLPQSNALLTEVTGGGGSEDWSTTAGAGTVLWSGSTPAYFTESRERTFGGSDDVLIRRTLIVETDLRDWTEGETVTFTCRGSEYEGKVQAIEARSLPGVGSLATTRLMLEVS
jgi:hypothetical protein